MPEQTPDSARVVFDYLVPVCLTFPVILIICTALWLAKNTIRDTIKKFCTGVGQHRTGEHGVSLPDEGGQGDSLTMEYRTRTEGLTDSRTDEHMQIEGTNEIQYG